MIELEGAGYTYSTTGGGLPATSASIQAGERVGLLGPNGCGKTTLLKLLDGLLLPERGTVRYRGEAITRKGLKDADWERWLRREVALVLQEPEAMLFNPTVYHEIVFGAQHHGMPNAGARARRWAREVGLARQLRAPPLRLSGGQKQRLALAAVLILEPNVVLLDEPAATLDGFGIRWLLRYIADHPELTFVVATHHWGLARRIATRLLVLDETGAIVLDAPPGEAAGEAAALERAGVLF